MKKDEIHLWDWNRILFGQAPHEFLIEVFIRSLVIYILAILVMRWLGKRMNGQLTIIELAVMVMMGATLSVPMQLPDRGLMQGLLVLLCLLVLLRGINWIAFRNSNFEKTLQGEMTILVKDGVLQLDEISDTRISKPQLYAALRGKGIYHLGQVKRVYLEGCGTYSIYTHDERRPGLVVFPEKDKAMYHTIKTMDHAQACINCGYVLLSAGSDQDCPNCQKKEWTKAVI